MGTHPSCPSTRRDGGESLKDYLKLHPQLLGDKVVTHFGDDLPFLFKVCLLPPHGRHVTTGTDAETGDW